MTDPRGGRLLHDGIDGGPNGTNVRRPAGTVMSLECRKSDRSQRSPRGRVSIEFDGSAHEAVCRMQPVPKVKCLEWIKTPRRLPRRVSREERP